MTPEGIERLREKLTRLKARLPALAEETARTAAFGDRSDNAEYKAAKGALRYATYESYHIEDQLKRVVPIERGSGAHGIVRLGSTVTIVAIDENKTTPKPDEDSLNKKIYPDKNASAAKQMTYEILGPSETDPSTGRISHLSPLGAAITGHKMGDVISVVTANGLKKYKIVEVK